MSSEQADPIAPLGADVFRRMAWLGPDALSSLVDTLVKHGDTESLHAGLVDGALKELETDVAVTQCVRLLQSFAAKAYSPTSQDTGEAELQLAQEWVQQRALTEGSSFIEAVALKMKGRVSEAHFAPILQVLMRPEFGLDVRAELRVIPEEAAQNNPDRKRYSLLGQIADSYSSVALDLIGPSVERFPDTTAAPPEESGGRWLMLNLAEQITYFNNTNDDLLTKMVDLATPGSQARDQLGELVLTLLVNQDRGFLKQDSERVKRLLEKSDCINDERALSIRVGVSMLGAGVDFPDPDFAWDYVRKANSYVGSGFDYISCDLSDVLPLSHAVLYLNPQSCSRELGSRALSRMITEGGVSMGVTDSKGRTLLQAAASVGHEEVVEVLLRLGADPRLTGKGAGRKTAAAIADSKGHSVVAKMIRAHEAQGAIASVLARTKPEARPT